MHLTVIHPFGDYKRGDKITATEEIRKLLERDEDGKPHDNVTHVRRTAGSFDNVAKTPTEDTAA